MSPGPGPIEQPDAAVIPAHGGDEIAHAATQFATAVKQLGVYRIIVSANIASRQPMRDMSGGILAETVFGFVTPADRWWERPLALISPLAMACRHEGLPFWGDGQAIRTLHPNPAVAAIRLDRFQERAFFRSAIVVPVHLPFAQIGIGAFEPVRAKDRLETLFQRDARTLMVLTRRFISGYVLAGRRRLEPPPDCALSVDEVKCLRWAAEGHTDHEIGLMVGHPYSAVRRSLQRAARKLDAVTRGQTIFKAGQLGYLGATETPSGPRR